MTKEEIEQDLMRIFNRCEAKSDIKEATKYIYIKAKLILNKRG